MDKQECSCSEKNPLMTCLLCCNGILLPYWCDTCQRLVPEKRCPCCGLKAHKVRQPG